jgi:hypothetical protein
VLPYTVPKRKDAIAAAQQAGELDQSIFCNSLLAVILEFGENSKSPKLLKNITKTNSFV